MAPGSHHPTAAQRIEAQRLKLIEADVDDLSNTIMHAASQEAPSAQYTLELSIPAQPAWRREMVTKRLKGRFWEMAMVLQLDSLSPCDNPNRQERVRVTLTETKPGVGKEKG